MLLYKESLDLFSHLGIGWILPLFWAQACLIKFYKTKNSNYSCQSQNEPIRFRSEYIKRALSAGKVLRERHETHDWLWFFSYWLRRWYVIFQPITMYRNANQIHSKNSDENKQRSIIKKLNMTINLEKELVFSYPLNRLDKIVSQLKPVS